MSARSLDDLETPVAVVDVDRMRENLKRTASYCRERELDWRPHVKTHKVPALAAEQLAAGAVGVTVATPAEAEEMSEVCDDILVAYPPVDPGRLRRLVDLPEHVQLTIALDSELALQRLAAAARKRGRAVRVLVELDVGMRRTGVTSAGAAVALAEGAATEEALEFAGLLFYPGHVREPVREQTHALADLSHRLENVLDDLEGAGLPVTVVSGGSTPTLWRSHEVHGLTEIRPGTNIFNDRTTVAIGACSTEDLAYTVLATVVSTAVPGQAVIDAGSKALSKEEPRGPGGGYGALIDHPDVVVRALSEEHGILDLGNSEWRPSVGDRVRVVPNHVCVSVNLQDRLVGVASDEVVEEWQVAARRRA